jgi:hypothetical protein
MWCYLPGKELSSVFGDFRAESRPPPSFAPVEKDNPFLFSASPEHQKTVAIVRNVEAVDDRLSRIVLALGLHS